VSVGAVVVTVVVVPGISIDGRFWVWALVLGAVFGVLNGVVKPVLQILTIRYLFLSWGLVLLAINTATLWLLELLVSPLDIEKRLQPARRRVRDRTGGAAAGDRRRPWSADRRAER
jgi:uncharacterized membrane protein YvlD (DUF360 family)